MFAEHVPRVRFLAKVRLVICAAFNVDSERLWTKPKVDVFLALQTFVERTEIHVSLADPILYSISTRTPVKCALANSSKKEIVVSALLVLIWIPIAFALLLTSSTSRLLLVHQDSSDETTCARTALSVIECGVSLVVLLAPLTPFEPTKINAMSALLI